MDLKPIEQALATEVALRLAERRTRAAHSAFTRAARALAEGKCRRRYTRAQAQLNRARALSPTVADAARELHV